MSMHLESHRIMTFISLFVHAYYAAHKETDFPKYLQDLESNLRISVTATVHLVDVGHHGLELAAGEDGAGHGAHPPPEVAVEVYQHEAIHLLHLRPPLVPRNPECHPVAEVISLLHSDQLP